MPQIDTLLTGFQMLQMLQKSGFLPGKQKGYRLARG